MSKVATKEHQVGLDWMARRLGYKDIQDLAMQNGFKNPEEMARKSGFTDIIEYFKAPGFARRMDELRKSDK
jgi:hypothetical protein